MSVSSVQRERFRWLMALVGVGACLSSSVGLSQHGDTLRFLEQGGAEEEEEEVSPAMEFSVVVCIVLVLILLTILFECIKEYLEESASASMLPIIEKLFGEMTVLGFLSIFTFCVTQAGFFSVLSVRIYGESNELQETFEGVHYTIFFIMIFFVVQVLILEKEAEQIEQEWFEFDREARESDGRWTERAASYRQYSGRSTWRPSFANLLPALRNKKAESKHDQLWFKALREEFLIDRGLEPPFEPSAEPLEDDFNFARYLGMCLGHSLAKVVEIKPFMWALFAIATLVYFGVALLLGENETVLAWSWVGVAWVLYLFNVHFEQHLINLIKAYVPKDSYFAAGQRFPENESSSLLADESSYSLLPDWCNVDLDQYLASRSWWNRHVVGGVPNRQQTFYWMDCKGPFFYQFLLQINLLFIGVYGAMQILEFVPHMYKEQPLYLFIIYVIVATLPALFIMIYKKHLVNVLTPVCHVGSFRRAQVISSVIREEKTLAALRTFIIVYKLRLFAANAKPPVPSRKPRMHYSAYFNKMEIREVEKTFNVFDADGTGTISPGEFQDLMTKLGATMSDEELQTMVQRLDRDRSGGVSKDEFLQWYAENANEDHLSQDDFAKFLFDLFDDNKSGEITIGEFLKKLYALNTKFTVDDVGGIVKELDENDTGAVGLKEFEHFIHKYYPRELSLHQH